MCSRNYLRVLASCPLEAWSNGSNAQAAVVEDLNLAHTTILAPDSVVIDGTAEGAQYGRSPRSRSMTVGGDILVQTVRIEMVG